jgi:hypothetical protein
LDTMTAIPTQLFSVFVLPMVTKLDGAKHLLGR